MKKVLRVALLIGLIVGIGAHPAFSKLLFYDDCENKWISSDWTEAGNRGQNSLTLTTERARKGKASYKFVLAPYPTSGTETNVELVLRAIKNSSGNANFNFNQEYWMGWSIYIPSNISYPSTGSWALMTQFHGCPDSCDTKTRNPLASMALKSGGLTLSLIGEKDACTTVSSWGDRHYKGSANGLKAGAWNDIVIHFRYSYTSGGFYQMWLNGVKCIDDSGINCFNDSKGPYFKMGIYGHLDKYTTVYYDEIKVGDAGSSYSDVAPGGGSAPSSGSASNELPAPTLKVISAQ